MYLRQQDLKIRPPPPTLYNYYLAILENADQQKK